jgi:hypothetical protein
MDCHATSLAFRKVTRVQIKLHPVAAGDENRGEKQKDGRFQRAHGPIVLIGAQNEYFALSRMFVGI